VILDPHAQVPPAEQLGRVHLIGIGGAGMSGIARILLARGLAVSGSDAKDSAAVAALRALGAHVDVGHAAAQVDGAQTVVVSTAVRDSNPELVEARRLGLRVLHRSQALVAVMQGRRVAAVAGTHGKTTTTSMLTVALQTCGADPSFAIGGELAAGGANAHDGTGDVFVAEADESDESFLLYTPDVAIVTNVEADHLDHYGTVEAVANAFDAFCDRVVPGGLLVACVDDPGVVTMLDRAGARLAGRGVRVRRYGRTEGADVRIGPIDSGPTGTRFDLTTAEGDHHEVHLRVAGEHNALNATAAWIAAVDLGLPASAVLEGLEVFTGARRRFEPRGSAAGVRVVDDYAHHPTEVRAVLRAARTVVGSGRLVAVFQPHLFSRTRIFAHDFGEALGLADDVVVLDVYPAREDPEPGVTGALVAAEVPLPPGRVAFVPSWSQVAAEVMGRVRVGDLVLTIGAGDVTMLGPEILRALADADALVTRARDLPELGED